MPRIPLPYDGFIKATSENLPKVDFCMQTVFFNSPSFLCAETRNVKTLRSCRACYGDNAIGRVQLKRTGNRCEIMAEITPEHKVTSKNYIMHCEIDEKEEQITFATCLSCKAKNAGCKHAVAFIAWLERKSNEPPVTSVTCYWDRPTLSKIGSSLKFIKMSDIKPQRKFEPSEEDKAQFFDESCKEFIESSPKIAMVKLLTMKETYYMDHLMMSFKKNVRQQQHSADKFLKYCSLMMTDDKCKALASQTKDQSKSAQWYNLRFGRVTASKLYETSKCNTPNGALVNCVLGAVKIKLTEPMKRGQVLEGSVLKKVEKTFSQKSARTGLVMNTDRPIFGASPDGLFDDYVIEIKCPSAEKTFNDYFKNNFTEPAAKFKAQMCLQMVMCDREKGLFCVAHSDFEISNNVTILEVDFDAKFTSELMTRAEQFWKENIYKVIYEGF